MRGTRVRIDDSRGGKAGSVVGRLAGVQEHGGGVVLEVVNAPVVRGSWPTWAVTIHDRKRRLFCVGR